MDLNSTNVESRKWSIVVTGKPGIMAYHVLTNAPYVEVPTAEDAATLLTHGMRGVLHDINARLTAKSSQNAEEEKYLDLMRELALQPTRETRNAVTRAVCGRSLRFSLSQYELDTNTGLPKPVMILPLLTSKLVRIRSVLQELLWFIRGETNTRTLGNGIWDLNSSRKFLDSRGLTEYQVGECGPIYGAQWRGKSPSSRDQLTAVIESLRSDPYSRRHLVNSWNVAELDKMALVPCHYNYQFMVTNDGLDDKLNCVVSMRSADIALGVPFNIASYAILTHLIAQITGKIAGELIINMADCHIYNEHVLNAMVQVDNPTYPFPTLSFPRVYELADIEKLTYSDFVISGYRHGGPIAYAMH